jgi:hypothetical protein
MLNLVEGGKTNMISIKVHQLFKNQSGFQAMRKISSCGKYEPATTILLKAVLRDLNSEFDKFVKDREDLLKGMALKDESGLPKIDNGNYVMDEEGKLQSNSLHEAFMNQEVIINRPKLKFSKLSVAELSPEDLIAIEGLIDENA